MSGKAELVGEARDGQYDIIWKSLNNIKIKKNKKSMTFCMKSMCNFNTEVTSMTIFFNFQTLPRKGEKLVRLTMVSTIHSLIIGREVILTLSILLTLQGCIS